MPNLTWEDAIKLVLGNKGSPMHYTEIADEIARADLRQSMGATPAVSVSAIISTSLQNQGDSSPFLRVSKGMYTLRTPGTQRPSEEPPPSFEEEDDETGFINAFGVYWQREKVLWDSEPRLLGRQQPGSDSVDFCRQRGVYLLHDGGRIVYVGRTTDQSLGTRLYQHTWDRLSGRWNRFSWFGVYGVTEEGKVSDALPNYGIEDLIAAMEALLIEGLEPPQNRKRGDGFNAVEFFQVEDPRVQTKHDVEVLDRLKKEKSGSIG